VKYLIVMPARGGSKSIPLKNIYPIQGKPLIEYSIEMILDVQMDADIVVSTDSNAIKAVVKKYQQVEVIDRPEAISGDKASTESALIHALEYMVKKYKKEYDAVITLQVTSPLRTAETVSKCIEAYEKNIDEYDALLTLTESRADYWVRDNSGFFSRLYPNAPRRRQEREPIFIENSALYITKASSLKETNSVLGYKTNGYPIPENEAIDINEPIDIMMVEKFMEEREQNERIKDWK